MAASPAQNVSGEIPVPGAASLAIKSNRTGAIFSQRQSRCQEKAFCRPWLRKQWPPDGSDIGSAIDRFAEPTAWFYRHL
jgi:hypothetical protein